jgi:hypothetical protein
MGKIPAGIMGGIKGKVGGIIGASWHGINYIKSYVIPTNPNTSGQQTQRSKMQLCILVGKAILTDIIQPFWNPFASYMSGVHLFNRENLLSVSNGTDYPSLIIAKGALTGLYYSDSNPVIYNDSVGSIQFNIDPVIEEGILYTDYLGFVVIDSDNFSVVSRVGEDQLADIPITFNIGAGRTAEDLHAFMFAYRGSGLSLELTNSVYSTVEASA